MKNKEKIWEIMKNNQRYLWALLVILLFLLSSKGFSSETKTSQECSGGKCNSFFLEPSLSEEKSSLFVNDVFDSQAGEYYRLTFREKSSDDVKISVKITDPLDNEREIKALSLEKSDGNNFKEILFLSDGEYSDVLFEKVNSENDAEVVISGVRATKLNISSDAELDDLEQTIFFKPNFSQIIQAQEKNNHSFKKSKQPKILFGQIFKNESDFLTEVEMDIDVVRQESTQGKNFSLELREAIIEEHASKIYKKILSKVRFSFDNIEQYRQEDGKFKFPIFAKVKKDKHYFIGINNDRVEVDEANHLLIRGSKEGRSYEDGSAAFKVMGSTLFSVGDIFFRIHGLKFEEKEEQKILLGTTIEDVGGGKGVFKYHPMDNRISLMDLYDYSEDVGFNDKEKIIYGENDLDDGLSFYSYKFETIQSFNRLNIKAEQISPGWNSALISYSFDGEVWQKAQFFSEHQNSEKREARKWNHSVEVGHPKDVFFVKIHPDNAGLSEEEKKDYGIKNFEIEAEVIME